jgi:pyruvate,water dikinase
MWRQWLFHPLATWQTQNKERAIEALHHLQSRYHTFRALLEDNNRSVSLLTDLGVKLRNANVDQKVRVLTEELIEVTGNLVDKLEQLGGGESGRLAVLHEKLSDRIGSLFAKLPHQKSLASVVPLDTVTDDMRGLVGGKAAVLARLRRTGKFRIPAGFVIPLSSCLLFLEKENLNLRLNALLQPYLRDTAAEIPVSIEEEVHRRIMATSLPPALQAALSEIARPFLPKAGGPGLAVRSSAVGEDGLRLSFAGQYSSVLHVLSPAMLEEAIKEVIASSFNKRNLSYRLHAGLDPLDFDLAVLCLSMVHARSAGTLFTRDPNSPSSRQMLVSAVYGLGELAVAGSIMTDIYRPNRNSGKDPSPSITRKERRLVCQDSGGVQEEGVPPAEQEKQALQADQLAILCRWGLAIEQLEHCPQDVEWAIDENGEPVLLQARPFRMAARARIAGRPGNSDRKLLLSGGVVASRGEGTGRVWMVRSRADLSKPPAGPYVLVMCQSLVDAVTALSKAQGVVVDLGNPVDHLSCVAREYGIPMVTGLGNAVERLQGLEWVMVDANGGRVWQPLDKDIEEALALAASMPEKESIPEIPTDPLAAALYKLIVPLNLTDAYGPTFSIAECQTLHDLIRFAHEKAVLSMFEMGDATLEKNTDAVRHLESEIPFILSIIDLGGGLHSQSGPGRWIKSADIVSFPMNALWRGIADPKVNWGPPSGGVALGSVMSRFLTDHKSARPVGLPNYAIVTRDYLNLNARMDFHFIMIDSVCGIDSRSNYIRFRFKGGGTSAIQRRRRVQCIVEVLESSGFACDARDDLVTAELMGAPQQIIEEKLSVLGRLLGFTRLLDAAMRSDETPGLAVEAFLSGNYQVSAELMSADKVE